VAPPPGGVEVTSSQLYAIVDANAAAPWAQHFEGGIVSQTQGVSTATVTLTGGATTDDLLAACAAVATAFQGAATVQVSGPPGEVVSDGTICSAA
jgi:hypothetical protein